MTKQFKSFTSFRSIQYISSLTIFDRCSFQFFSSFLSIRVLGPMLRCKEICFTDCLHYFHYAAPWMKSCISYPHSSHSRCKREMTTPQSEYSHRHSADCQFVQGTPLPVYHVTLYPKSIVHKSCHTSKHSQFQRTSM